MVLVTFGHSDHVADAKAIANMHRAPPSAPAGLSQPLGFRGFLPGNLANRMHQSSQDALHVGGEARGFMIGFRNGFKLWPTGAAGVFGDMRLAAGWRGFLPT